MAKLFVGLDPSLRSTGICCIYDNEDKKPLRYHLGEVGAEFIEEGFLGNIKACKEVAVKICNFISKATGTKSALKGGSLHVLAEYPMVHGGFSTEKLWQLGGIINIWLQLGGPIDYQVIHPSTANALWTGMPKLKRNDRKRWIVKRTRAYLAENHFSLTHRGKFVEKPGNLTTKAGKPKEFKVSDNEAEALIYAFKIMHINGYTIPGDIANEW